MTEDDLRAVVAAAFEGILRRPAGAALEEYVRQLHKGEITLPQLFQFFCTLDEFYDRNVPQDRRHAISSLYSGEGRYGDPFIWPSYPSNLVFLHFPKTAGLSIRKLITARFHPLQLGHGDLRSENGLYGRYQTYFSWHMTWPEYDAIPGPKKSFTCLRDPSQRLISLFRFLAAIGTTALPPYYDAAVAAMDGAKSFFETSNPEIINHIDNHYVRVLAGAFADSACDPLRRDPSRALDKATERALSFDMLFFLEEVITNQGKLPPRAVRFLSDFFGSTFPNEIPRENPTIAPQANVPPEYLAKHVEFDDELCRRIKAALFPSAIIPPPSS